MHFGYPFDAARIQLALQAIHPELPCAAAWRVRLLPDASGQPRTEKFELNNTQGPVKIALATRPFEASHSEFTRFKTTRRAHYEAFNSTDAAVFDTLLYNTAGELTECTRGNIALLLDGRWVTPPLHCGLLDGIGREMYLKDGRMTEAVVRVEDLPRAQALAFVSSVGGWLCGFAEHSQSSQETSPLLKLFGT